MWLRGRFTIFVVFAKNFATFVSFVRSAWLRYQTIALFLYFLAMPISWRKLLAIVGYALKCLKWFCTRNSPALSVTSLTFGTWLVHTKAQASSCYGFCTRHNEFLLTGFPSHQTLVYITLCSTCVIGEMKYIINSKYRAYKDLQNDTKNMYVWQGTR